MGWGLKVYPPPTNYFVKKENPHLSFNFFDPSPPQILAQAEQYDFL